MPTFTVTVKDVKTGNTKQVTVNTDGMVATVVSEEPVTTTVVEPVVEPAVKSVTAPAEVSTGASDPASITPVVTTTDPASTAVTNEVNTFHKNNMLGGKRSTSLFRLKKRRITRKLKKSSK
jgi:hypothetical protein